MPSLAALLRHRSRAGLLVLAVLAISSVLLLRQCFTTHDGNAILRLELARSGAAFAQSVRDDWVQEAADPLWPGRQRQAWCGVGLPHVPSAQLAAASAPVVRQLRCNLVADSVGLVPAYAGLLLLFTLAAVPAAWGPALRLACGVPALAAGLADLTENGLTWQALDLMLQQPAIATASVPDAVAAGIRQASQAKWLLIAAANALLGHLLFWHGGARAGHRLQRSAGPMLAASALALAVGGLAWPTAIGPGMGLMIAALGLHAWGWRHR